MNSVPVKHYENPRDVLDNLIADVGLKTVVLTLLSRVLKLHKAGNTVNAPELAKQPGVDQLSDHLRQDMGLPPNEKRNLIIDPVTINRHNFF